MQEREAAELAAVARWREMDALASRFQSSLGVRRREEEEGDEYERRTRPRYDYFTVIDD